MADLSPSIAADRREIGRTPEGLAAQYETEMADRPGPCWALDASRLRDRILPSAARPLDWANAILAEAMVAEVNPQAAHLLGPLSGRAGMIGHPVVEFWPPESRPALAELIMAVLADRSGPAVKTRTVTSLQFDNPMLTVWTVGSSGLSDIVFVAATGPVADARSLWQLRASEVRYRNLIQYLPSAVLQVDSTPLTEIFDELRRKGITNIAAYLDQTPELPVHARTICQVTDANRSAVHLFGADSVDQLIGPVGYLFEASPDTPRRVIAAHFDGMRNFSEVMKLRTLDGRLRDVKLSVTYPALPDRLDVTIFGIDDITERLVTEAQLRQLQADYSRAARISMLGELATSIAHEVNQPLAAIVTNAETSQRWLARDEPNLAKVAQLTTRIAESARRASEIVQRIRGMAARREPERAAVDLNEIVDEALMFVRHEIESRSIALSTDFGSGLPRVLGDRVQLQQVIVNLLVNAVQAQNGGADGWISLATSAANGAVEFAIRDAGPGIADEDLDRIFGSFFTTKDDGIGIGLALCQSIIVTLGGTITASNHRDGGALFRVSLPAIAD